MTASRADSEAAVAAQPHPRQRPPAERGLLLLSPSYLRHDPETGRRTELVAYRRGGCVTASAVPPTRGRARYYRAHCRLASARESGTETQKEGE